MDGFEICTQIRSLVDCPILFLTAKTQETDIVRGLGLGGDDYITKPFGANELRARVNAHLRRDAREKKYSVNISGVTFLLNAKEAQYNSEKLLLTKSEYEICEYLALHRGQVFSKEQIYEAVFGFDGESDDAVIATHIKNIRNKLLSKNLSPIETVWGLDINGCKKTSFNFYEVYFNCRSRCLMYYLCKHMDIYDCYKNGCDLLHC